MSWNLISQKDRYKYTTQFQLGRDKCRKWAKQIFKINSRQTRTYQLPFECICRIIQLNVMIHSYFFEFTADNNWFRLIVHRYLQVVYVWCLILLLKSYRKRIISVWDDFKKIINLHSYLVWIYDVKDYAFKLHSWF